MHFEPGVFDESGYGSDYRRMWTRMPHRVGSFRFERYSVWCDGRSRVECNYNSETVVFQVDGGSNAYYFAALVEYVNGDGEIGLVELKQALDSDTWLPMSHS
ncbi:hypothetical protein YC2023_048675 [Brassica napus]